MSYPFNNEKAGLEPKKPKVQKEAKGLIMRCIHGRKPETCFQCQLDAGLEE